MKQIRIIRHIDCEGPAYFLNLVDAANMGFELIRVDANDELDFDLDTTSGLISMGGSMSVNDDLPWIEQECEVIRECVKRDIPVLGICLGSQLLARALGARVYSGPCLELGWYPVSRQCESPWLNGLKSHLNVFHWHGETFDLPQNATLLLGNVRYPHQAFAVGPHLGLQFHVEMLPDMVKEWLKKNPDDLKRSCDVDYGAAAILQDTEKYIDESHNTAEILFQRWAANCKI